MKNKISVLQKTANVSIKKVSQAIRDYTKKRTLTIFGLNEDCDPIDLKGELIDSDDFYNLPYGYYVDKHWGYNHGVVKSITNGIVILFDTGENYGDTTELGIDDLPFETRVELLSYINESEDDK